MNKQLQVIVAVLVIAVGALFLGIILGSTLVERAPTTSRVLSVPVEPTPFMPTSPTSPRSTCPTGYFTMAETAALYVTAAVDDGRTYHYIPMGDPVATTGKCDGHFAQLMHGGDTGWVFKDLID